MQENTVSKHGPFRDHEREGQHLDSISVRASNRISILLILIATHPGTFIPIFK